MDKQVELIKVKNRIELLQGRQPKKENYAIVRKLERRVRVLEKE